MLGLVPDSWPADVLSAGHTARPAVLRRSNRGGSYGKRGMQQQQAYSKKRTKRSGGAYAAYPGYEAGWEYAPEMLDGCEGPMGYGSGPMPVGGAFKVRGLLVFLVGAACAAADSAYQSTLLS